MNKKETTSPAQPSQTPQPQVPQPMQTPQPSSASQPPASQTPPAQPSKKPKRRWPWVLVAVLILFLGTIGGVVPVENIPILRNIAHAMGFTPDEAKQMSFLRALLTWTDKTLGLNGRLSPRPNLQGQSRLFSAESAAADNAAADAADQPSSLQGKMTRYTGKSSLFDISTLNELQLQQGRPAEQVTGTVILQPGQKVETRAIIPGTDGTANTDANQTPNEVYFGNALGRIDREANIGYESVNTLKKVANPHIADGGPIDWLQRMTSRLMQTDPGLVGIDKELGNSVIGWQMDIQEWGDEKGQRDLYYVWITSRMSKYTNNLMLQKRLADIGFLGGEIPTHVSESFTTGGIRIDTDALTEDQEGWKKYQEFERKCKEELLEEGRGGDKIKKAVDRFNSKFSTARGGTHPGGYNVGFPKNCQAWIADGKKSYSASVFGQNIAQIYDECKDTQEGYAKLKTLCLMDVEYEGKCKEGTLDEYEDRYNSFIDYCQNECENRKQECQSKGGTDCDKVKTDCETEIAEATQWTDKDKKIQKIADTEELVLSKVGAAAPYFPQITIGNKDGGNEAQEYEDKYNRVQKTLIENIKKNQVL